MRFRRSSRGLGTTNVEVQSDERAEHTSFYSMEMQLKAQEAGLTMAIQVEGRIFAMNVAKQFRNHQIHHCLNILFAAGCSKLLSCILANIAFTEGLDLSIIHTCDNYSRAFHIQRDAFEFPSFFH